jgi:hypothetical protein
MVADQVFSYQFSVVRRNLASGADRKRKTEDPEKNHPYRTWSRIKKRKFLLNALALLEEARY